MHLDTFTKTLGISNHKVTHIIKDTDQEIYFYLKKVDERAPAVCSSCSRVHSRVHDVETVTVEDLPIIKKRVFLVFDKRKLECDEDDTVRVEEFSWLRGRFTLRYSEQVYRLTSITSNQEVGWFLHQDDEVIYGMLWT
jgi:transposase